MLGNGNESYEEGNRYRGVTDERGGNGSEKTSAKTKPKTNKRWKMDIRGR